MKKLFFPVLASLVFLLSSCLGDSDSSFSATNQFGVVKTIKSTTGAGSKYFIVPGYFLTFNEVNNSVDGDAMYLSYFKGNTSDTNSAGITKITDYVVATSYPNSVQKQIIQQTVDTVANRDAGIGLRALKIITPDPTGYMLNRNLLEYSISQKEGEIYDISFYYDSGKQVDKSGSPLKDRAVIDVFLTKRGTGVGKDVLKNIRFVLNATVIREKLQPSLGSFTGTQPLVRYVDFRYSIYDTATEKYKQGYTSSMMYITYYATTD